jgi:hypothetical protein
MPEAVRDTAKYNGVRRIGHHHGGVMADVLHSLRLPVCDLFESRRPLRAENSLFAP